MTFVMRGFLGVRVWAVTITLTTALGVLGASASTATAASPPIGLLASSITTQGGFGTIKGRLVWGGAEAPGPRNKVEKGKADKNPEVCAKDEAIPDESLVVAPKTKGIRNGFAYLPKPAGQNPEVLRALVAKDAKVVIDQKNCRFVPHVSAFTQGQAVVFQSSDPVSHNLRYSPFRNAPLNQVLAPKGQLEAKLVPERMPVKLQCDLHPWMVGYMMIFEHPFFAITGDDGSFEIKGVPAGPQNLVVWQEAVGYVTAGMAAGMPVVVKVGETVNVGDVLLDPARVKPR